MVETELLILAVQGYPCIWNTNLEEFHNKSMREASWKSVCSDLIEDWDSLRASEKYEKLSGLRKRWTNIRDYYRKAVFCERDVETGKRMIKRKRYVYFEMLSFLRPIYDRRSMDEDCPQKEVIYPVTGGPEELEPSPQPPAASPMSSAITESSSRQKSKKDRTKTIDTILKAIQRDRVKNPQEEDADFLFLKSLLPDMKKLSDDKKIEFKMSAMKSLYDLRKDSS